MAADLPENYEAHMDAFQFIKDVAVDWDDTKVLEAEPGDYIIIARKAKGKPTGSWAPSRMKIAGTLLNVEISDAGKKYAATIYHDGDNASWNDKP